VEIGFKPRPFVGSVADPPPEADLRVLPINLATALSLAGSSPIEIALAGERVRAAAAGLELARAAWLPSITFGADYDRHDGPAQGHEGNVNNSSHNSLMFGAGSGMGTSSVLSFNDAIFGPLAARQVVRAQQAEVQVTTNNVMVAVTDAYFSVEQARGQLAGDLDVTKRTEELLRRVRKLAEGIVPPLEVIRTEAELARRHDAELLARERWQVRSADLMRILRLDATAQVEPLEPPELQVQLIDLNPCVDELVAIGLSQRPELAAFQAQIQAALARVRQEKFRPFVPSLWVRGFSTGASGTLGAGVFVGGGGTNTLHAWEFRDDFDVQLLWQLDNLGFGNRARVHERQSDYRAANLELQRMADRVAAEVAQAYAEARQAARRIGVTELEVKLSLESYEKNLEGLGQTKRAGELVVTVIRPQEVVAAIQALADAYNGYFLAVADSNRAQFRLYRAMGQPAQLLTCQPPKE
jgi:outer membrane protein TolC